MIKERPILFSTDMVQALLEGRKTQTRRIIKPQPLKLLEISNDDGFNRPVFEYYRFDSPEKGWSVVAPKCPYGWPGDVLWVRESFTAKRYDWQDLLSRGSRMGITYKADNHYPDKPLKWKPSIHMPKKAARIWLKVTDVRVERVQDITEEDGKDEGSPLELSPCNWHHHYDWFKNLWNKINGDESWKANPWVWVVDFEVLSTTGKPDFENVEWLKKVNA